MEYRKSNVGKRNPITENLFFTKQPDENKNKKTEIDQNRFWMYYMRRAVEWLQNKYGIDTIAGAVNEANKNVNIVHFSPHFIRRVMRNDINNLLSERSIMVWSNDIGLDSVAVARKAAADYIAERLEVYKLDFIGVEDKDFETYPPDSGVIEWIVQKGFKPHSHKGELIWASYSNPFKT